MNNRQSGKTQMYPGLLDATVIEESAENSVFDIFQNQVSDYQTMNNFYEFDGAENDVSDDEYNRKREEEENMILSQLNDQTRSSVPELSHSHQIQRPKFSSPYHQNSIVTASQRFLYTQPPINNESNCGTENPLQIARSCVNPSLTKSGVPNTISQPTADSWISSPISQPTRNSWISSSWSQKDAGRPKINTGVSKQEAERLRKFAHLNSEKRRRCKMNDAFQNLKDALPKFNDSQNVTKIAILTEAANYIKSLQKKSEPMDGRELTNNHHPSIYNNQQS